MNHDHIFNHINIELSPDGQKILSVLEIKSELPPYINGIINEELNIIATEFLSKIRNSLQDLIFEYDNEEEEVIRDTSLFKTIADNDWSIEEKQYETAIRFFPGLLLEKTYGYPIQCLIITNHGEKYNSRNVSLIPLVVELGIELHQFAEELRGGLLCPYVDGQGLVWSVLQCIMCYSRDEDENIDLLDGCFLAVFKRLRENNHLIKEDIRQYNLVGELFSKANG
jgi:hypothetical protein